MSVRPAIVLTALVLAAAASAPADAITCGSGSVGDFSIKCDVLTDTPQKFRMRVSTNGDLAAVIPTVATFNFTYTGNWHAQAGFVFYDSGLGFAAQAATVGWGMHINPPHGEGVGPFFDASLGAVFENGVLLNKMESLPHGGHFDRWSVSHFYNRKNQYQYNLGAIHTPEPTTWIMLATGFGAIGTMIRRRRHRPTSQAQNLRLGNTTANRH